MRDILNTFGTVTTSSANAAKAFDYGVDTLTANGLGLVDNLYVKAKIQTKAPGNEAIIITVKHGADTATMNALVVETFPAKVWAIGDELKVKIPAEHLRYLTLEVATTTTGVGFTAYLERG